MVSTHSTSQIGPTQSLVLKLKEQVSRILVYFTVRQSQPLLVFPLLSSADNVNFYLVVLSLTKYDQESNVNTKTQRLPKR